MKNNTIENNKLIAEFMELSLEKRYLSIKTGKLNKSISLDTYEDHILCYINEKNPVTITNLKYHSSWDWLMPVVEKIEGLGYPVKITLKYCSVARDYTYKEPLVVSEFRDTKIKKVYDVAVGFIKWYNKNKVQ